MACIIDDATQRCLEDARAARRVLGNAWAACICNNGGGSAGANTRKYRGGSNNRARGVGGGLCKGCDGMALGSCARSFRFAVRTQKCAAVATYCFHYSGSAGAGASAV